MVAKLVSNFCKYDKIIFFSVDDVDGEKKKGSEWADTDRDYTYVEVSLN